MIRKVSFLDDGRIVVAGEESTDIIYYGVVLLTRDQAEEAERYGWKRIGAHPSETEMGLERVQRNQPHGAV
jgi:hypothetical protein